MRNLPVPLNVEYKMLGEVGLVQRGGNLQKRDLRETGEPAMHYGQIYTKYGVSATETFSFVDTELYGKSKKARHGDIVMAVTSENVEDVCRCVAWLGDRDVAVSGHVAIIQHTLNPKFLSYFFHSEQFQKQKKILAHGTKVIEVTPKKLEAVRVPVPPVEVQEEIVRVLDSFAEQEAELEKMLVAELEARKAQYAYYRDKLLDFGSRGGGALDDPRRVF